MNRLLDLTTVHMISSWFSGTAPYPEKLVIFYIVELLAVVKTKLDLQFLYCTSTTFSTFVVLKVLGFLETIKVLIVICLPLLTAKPSNVHNAKINICT